LSTKALQKRQAKIFKLLISFVVFSLVPSAYLKADPGFWELEGIDIPAVIKENGHSVYQLVVLAETPDQRLTKAEYKDALSEEKHLLEEDLKKPATESSGANLARYYQLASCMASGMDQCELFQSIALGTAFEAKINPDTSSLWTCYSSVKDLIGSQAQGDIRLNVILVAEDGEVVYDTRFPGHTARIIRVAPEIDVVQIQLDETLGKPLVFGEQDGSLRERLEDIYIVGFPLVQREETNNEDYYASSMNRHRINVTIGEIFQDPQHSRELSEAKQLQCDADSAPGMNGAPAFNESGEVIGIFVRPTKYKVGSILTPLSQVAKYFSIETR
jgi:hypothetical protein